MGGAGGEAKKGRAPLSPTRRTAAAIAKLALTDPNKAKAALRQYGDSIPDEDLAYAGLERPKERTSFMDRAKGLGGRALGVANGVFDVLDRPSQAVLGTLSAFTPRDADTRGDLTSPRTYAEAAGRAVDGVEGTGTHRNLRSATGLDPNGGGRLAGLFDFIGTTALDPTTYLSVGAKPVAEKALGQVVKELGEDAGKAVAKRGITALTDAEVRRVTRSIADSAAQAGSKNADKTASDAIEALGRRGRGGVVLAGTTVVPAEPLRRVASLARITDSPFSRGVTRALGQGATTPGAATVARSALSELAGTPAEDLAASAATDIAEPAARKTLASVVNDSAPVRWAQAAFVPRSALRQRYGALVGSQVYDRLGKAQAEFANDTEDVARRLSQAANASGVSPEVLDNVVLPALDAGGNVGETVARLRQAGDLKVADLLETLDTIRNETADKLVASGLATSRDAFGAHLDEAAKAAMSDAEEKATEAAMKDLPFARAAAQNARRKADAAMDKLGDLKADLSVAHEAGSDMTFGLGKRLALAEQQARQLDAAATQAETALASVLKKSDEKLARVPQIVDEAGAKAWDKARAKFDGPPVLRGVDDYVPRQLTKDGRKALVRGDISRQGMRPSALAGDMFQDGAMKGRTIMPDASVTEVNDALGPKLGLGGGKTLLETDPVKLFAQRASSANKAVAEARFVDYLTRMTDAAGNPLLIKGEGAAAEAARLGYQEFDGGQLGKLYADPAIAKEVQRVQAVVLNDEAVSSVSRFMDRWMSLWKGYATVPLLGGTGFHVRNSIGNVFNNWLAGVTSLKPYTEATRMQLALGKALKSGDSLEAGLAKAGLSKAEVGRLMSARKTGVLSSDFFSADLGEGVLDDISVTTRGQRARRALNPLRRDNALISSGEAVGKRVEDNARLAHFLYKLDELGDVDEAALSVKKYLFDYGDLTALERTKLRRVVPFYTYMRKNTPLQLAELAKQPGKATTAARAERFLSGNDDPNAGSGEALPQYALQNGQRPLSKGAARFLTGGNDTVLGGVDTPLRAALTQLDPLVQTAALFPGLNKVLPQDPQGWQGVARQIASVPGGGPNEVAKFAVESATGKSLFTGGDVKGGTSATAKRLSNAIAPLFVKTVNLEQDLTGTGRASGRNLLRARLLNALVGLNITVVDGKAERGEQFRRMNELEAAIKALRDSGVSVPSISDLRDLGVAPGGSSKSGGVPGFSDLG